MLGRCSTAVLYPQNFLFIFTYLEIGSHLYFQVGLELTILVPHSVLSIWDWRHGPPCLAHSCPPFLYVKQVSHVETQYLAEVYMPIKF